MRIYQVALDLVESVMRLSRKVQPHDPDLARQMKRALASVPLNMQEGLYSQGGNRAARFHNAMGSARETMAALQVAVCAEYLTRAEVEADLDRVDHVVATLWKLSRRSPR